MLDSFDYKEPSCALCGGKEFYNPKKDDPIGRIPVSRIIEKVDSLFNKNDYEEAGKLLEYWKTEAQNLLDKNGELSIVSELIGFYRKTGKKQECFSTIDRANSLIEELKLTGVSMATIILNMATGYKAFGENEKAISLYEIVLKIYNEKLKSNDKLFAGLFNNMALALYDSNQIERAIEYFYKAIDILKTYDDEQVDSAISYVNLAHLYERVGDKKQTTNSLFSAYELLNDERVIKNGYYAYVLSKCAPSFGHFGYEKIEKEFIDLSKEIYERN